MKRVKAASLVFCVFVTLLVIFGSYFRATPTGAFFGALGATPVLVHVFNRLVPQRKESYNAPEPRPAEQPTVLRRAV